MAKKSFSGRNPGPQDLYFVPLGGTGEIGMNLKLYGHAGAWLMVDLGILFGDARLRGIEGELPDPPLLVARRESLAGLEITNTHEDPIGADPRPERLSGRKG